jgi:glyoxylase-like metal-dependent hydrolase (beta-lactamase superfamily II)
VAQDAQTNHAHPAPVLSYPFKRLERGQTLEVASGVHWIRMPLPFALDHINLWALDDCDGWAVVDTGTSSDDNTQVWRELFAQATDPRPISRIFVTHMHPDHVGMAGWLTRKLGIRLWMTRLEYLNCRVLASESGHEATPDAMRFYLQAGWSAAAVESYHRRFGVFGKHIHALPDSYRRLQDGEEVRIGARDWRVVVGSGHSPEHACLYCPALRVLISGDQVLPRISSNISVYPSEPDADPMRDWLDSLQKLKREVPADVLVLPSHNEPFYGLHARLDQLAADHERTFGRLKQALQQPRRAVELSEALFGRAIGEDNIPLLHMATGEAMACLNYLMYRGEVRRVLADDGVHRYLLC